MGKLAFIGTGEAFDPRLPNTSLLYDGRARILFDCGYGVPHALWRVLHDPDALDAVYLSHRHADHCFGLPALVVWMRVAGRQRPLRLLGGAGSTPWIRDVLELGYEGAYDPSKCFPLEFTEISPGRAVELDGVVLRTAVSEHGMTNHAVRVEADGAALCYSGDGAPTDATRALYQNATVLVHECYGATAGVEGHAAADEVLELAVEADVGTLCLLHLERGMATKQAVVERVRARSGETNVIVPAPGDEFQVAALPRRA